MDTGNGNENGNKLIPGAELTEAHAQFVNPTQVPVTAVRIDTTFKNQDNLQKAIPVSYNALSIPGTLDGAAQFVNPENKFPSAPQENQKTLQNNAEQWIQNAYGPSKDPTAIDPSKLKDLVGKSYAQTLLYLNLTKQIIKGQLKNNTDDTTLTDLQGKIDKSIKELELSTEAKQKLQVNPISEDSSVTISELLLEIAGLGMAAAAAGGKRRSKKSKKRRGKSKKRRTRRH